MPAWGNNYHFHPDYEEEMQKIVDAYELLREEGGRNEQGHPLYSFSWLSLQMEVSHQWLYRCFRRGQAPSLYFLSRAQQVLKVPLGVPANVEKSQGKRPKYYPGVAPVTCVFCLQGWLKFVLRRNHWEASCRKCQCLVVFPAHLDVPAVREQVLRELLVQFRVL